MLIFSSPIAYFTRSYVCVFKQVWLTLLIGLLCTVNLTIAEEPFADKPSDVRIIVDISGSMKKNDPENLRLPAVDMLSKLLPDGSKAGIWTFGQFINMLVKHREVDQSWKQDASVKASGINSVGQYTNIGEALEKAAYDKNYSSTGKYQTHVILLTDGMVDIDRDPSVNERERSRIINTLLPMYQKAGFIIHTVSLSEKADKKLMDKLALATGGQSAVAKTADELMDIFLQIFNRAVPQEELPFDGNSFLTDSSIEEFTALIFREPMSPETTLFAPDKSDYTKDTKDKNVSWYRTDKYDLITVRQPLEGEWQVLADLAPKSRITVVSDLSLRVKSIPSNLMVNNVVDFSLAFREDNKVVDRAEFLDLLDINVTVNSLDTAEGLKETSFKKLSDGLVPGNGVYNTLLERFNEVGEYEVIVDVDGKTFQRRSVQRLNVRTPFKVETQIINEDDNTQFNIEVIPQSESIDITSTQVVAKLKPPKGSTLIKPFELTNSQAWALSFKPEDEGIYRVTIRITTTNNKGDTNDIIPKALTFSYPVVDTMFEPPSSVVEGAVIEAEPAAIKEEPSVELKAEDNKAADNAETEQKEPEKNESNMMQWILYGVIALVNLIIVAVIFFLYRKFVKPKKEEPEEAAEDTAKKELEAPSAAGELPMDEMAIDELDDIDLAEDDSVEQAVTASDALADLVPETLDDGSGNSLDDSLDDSLDEALNDNLGDESEIDEGLFDDLEKELDDLDSAVEDIPKEKPDESTDDSTGDNALDDVETGLIDEEPEFSLDDFSPDPLDEDDIEKK
jgi:uncharacterized protein (TIGR03503 family)